MNPEIALRHWLLTSFIASVFLHVSWNIILYPYWIIYVYFMLLIINIVLSIILIKRKPNKLGMPISAIIYSNILFGFILGYYYMYSNVLTI